MLMGFASPTHPPVHFFGVLWVFAIARVGAAVERWVVDEWGLLAKSPAACRPLPPRDAETWRGWNECV